VADISPECPAEVVGIRRLSRTRTYAASWTPREIFGTIAGDPLFQKIAGINGD
jgi:hypothetical protein